MRNTYEADLYLKKLEFLRTHWLTQWLSTEVQEQLAQVINVRKIEKNSIRLEPNSLWFVEKGSGNVWEGQYNLQIRERMVFGDCEGIPNVTKKSADMI